MSAIHFDRMKPGDLITAQFVNQILTEVEHLQEQIDALTGGQVGGPVITALVPGGDVPAGSPLQILGRNFATPAYLNAISLDNIALTGFLEGSGETVLKIGLPPGLPGLPKTMTLEVKTAKGSAHASVHVVPGVPTVGGKPVIRNVTTGQPTIQAGQTYTLSFQVDGQQLLTAEQFTLAPSYGTVAPPDSGPQWIAGAKVQGSAQITLAPGEVKTIQVLATVPAGGTSGDLSLRVTSAHNSPGSDGQSLPLSLVVGQPAPNNDLGVGMVIGETGVNTRKASIDGEPGLQVRYGAGPLIRIDATFKDAGTYLFTVAVPNAGAVWTVTQPPEAVAVAANGNKTVTFNLKLNATGPVDEKRYLTVTASRQGAAPGAATSAIRFPITGFAT